MIDESCYWKAPLLKMAKRLRLFRANCKLNQKQRIQIERDIFVGFYSVRKLFDAIPKVTDATRTMKVQVSWHPNQKAVTWMNYHKIDELYDLNISNRETRDVLFVCGRIIHSFVFSPPQQNLWADSGSGSRPSV